MTSGFNLGYGTVYKVSICKGCGVSTPRLTWAWALVTLYCGYSPSMFNNHLLTIASTAYATLIHINSSTSPCQLSLPFQRRNGNLALVSIVVLAMKGGRIM